MAVAITTIEQAGRLGSPGRPNGESNMQYTFARRAAIADHPANIPANALVFNAPRPLYGTMTADAALTWQSGFLSGVHYAAVSPNDDYRHEWVRHNKEMDAVLVWYVSEAEAMRLVTQYVTDYLDTHPKASISGGLDAFVERNWRQMFFNHFGAVTVTVDSDTLEIE
jgi:hypothetical protein